MSRRRSTASLPRATARSRACCAWSPALKRLGADSFVDWSTHTHIRTDPQFYMHVDTYHPTWKIFVFQKTTLDQGPLHYVYGSHRNSLGKLRWLYNRTRTLVSNRDTPTKTYEALGPFSDATHGFHPSLRVVGFEPPAWRQKGVIPGASFRGYGFADPTPIVAGEGMTLVVVDVSGLHFRGYAEAGHDARLGRIRGRRRLPGVHPEEEPLSLRELAAGLLSERSIGVGAVAHAREFKS